VVEIFLNEDSFDSHVVGNVLFLLFRLLLNNCLILGRLEAVLLHVGNKFRQVLGYLKAKLTYHLGAFLA
jgi:hypothetical protein